VAELSENSGSRIEDGTASSWTREQILDGALYTGIAALTPVYAVVVSTMELTARAIVGLVIGSLIAGGTALKAFLSKSKPNPPDQQPPQPIAPTPTNQWPT
jgi:hypothetical protein